MTDQPSKAQIATYLRKVKGMQCNCDLDRWEPERTTWHSWVCRIHEAAMKASKELRAEVMKSLKGEQP